MLTRHRWLRFSRSARFALAYAALALVGCARSHGAPHALPDKPVRTQPVRTKPDATVPLDDVTLDVNPAGRCLYSASVESYSGPDLATNVDLLFVVSNSERSGPLQQALSARLPGFLQMLLSGDLDHDGTPDQPPATSLHAGLVTSDMGLSGTDGVAGCRDVGQDGVLQYTTTTNAIDPACRAVYPAFLTYAIGSSDTAGRSDLSCLVAGLGTSGCMIEQPLEAALKALWPTTNPAREYDPRDEGEPIAFLSNPITLAGMHSHGDVENAGFLRDSSSSLLAVIVVADGDDCSIADPYTFAPGRPLDPKRPLAAQSPKLRCHFYSDELQPITRYQDAFVRLRSSRFFFALMAGVPPAALAELEMPATGFRNANEHVLFYDKLLNDPRLEETIDDNGTPDVGSDDRLRPACSSESGAITAESPLRLLRAASKLGTSGSVQSVCNDDFGPSLSAIAAGIGAQLRASCLTGGITRNQTGRVPCELSWDLPPADRAGPDSITTCSARPFLHDTNQASGNSGQRCSVDQVALQDRDRGDGWYYDDFSPEIAFMCLAGGTRRIGYTASAKPPPDVFVAFSCAHAVGDGCATVEPPVNGLRIGAPCLPANIPLPGFDLHEVQIETGNPDCKGDVCLVDRLMGNPSPDCSPASHACAKPAEARKRVYCSCRCDSKAGGDACQCPDGFSCVDSVSVHEPTLDGSYCRRDGTQ